MDKIKIKKPRNHTSMRNMKISTTHGETHSFASSPSSCNSSRDRSSVSRRGWIVSEREELETLGAECFCLSHRGPVCSSSPAGVLRVPSRPEAVRRSDCSVVSAFPEVESVGSAAAKTAVNPKLPIRLPRDPPKPMYCCPDIPRERH